MSTWEITVRVSDEVGLVENDARQVNSAVEDVFGRLGLKVTDLSYSFVSDPQIVTRNT